MKNQKFKKALAMSFVFVVLALMYIPIIILIVFSFTSARTVGTWNGFTLDLYVQLLNDSEIHTALLNTLIIAGASSAIATVLGTLASIGIFYMKRRAKAITNTVSQITVLNADIVTAVAFMVFFSAIGLRSSGFISLIIAHSAITTPFVMLMVSPRLAQLNKNLYDAGLDLGAGHGRTLWSVLLPQLIPAMIAGFAMAFTLSLDDFVITKFNNAGMIDTLSTYLYNKITKKGLPAVLKSLSSVIFIVSFVTLLLVNLYSNKKNKKSLIA